MLTETECQELENVIDRPLIIMSWLMDFASGTKSWNVPPPVKAMYYGYTQDILTAYGDCLKIIDTTVPFPSLQIGMTILNIFYISWPFLMAQLSKSIVWAMLMSFVPILAFFAV